MGGDLKDGMQFGWHQLLKRNLDGSLGNMVKMEKKKKAHFRVNMKEQAIKERHRIVSSTKRESLKPNKVCPFLSFIAEKY